ncbi:hypothetical protein [Pseudoalteromonas byunsanensis]|nr:hypothetical protein [Pseudoalteromonas byunsanensis]
MNLEIKKKAIKSLSNENKQLPFDATKNIGGGKSIIMIPTDYRMCGDQD